MNIVIVHCHFERGGVTQVAENHVAWLANSDDIDRIVLVSGGRNGGVSDGTCQATEQVALPTFDYDSVQALDENNPLDSRAAELVRQWDELMRSINLSADDTIVHWHNHSLGKNAAAPLVIRRLAESGWRMLLQIHDFAEDSRPENYGHLIAASGLETRAELDAFLYPVAKQIHYATLTRFDANVLAELGIPRDQSHCLPNSVAAASETTIEREAALAKVRSALKLPPGATWCLYPVRGIRRKNVGEFVLLSRMTPDDCYAGLTLCPTTPVENWSYERWRTVAERVAPRCVFDAAHHPDVSFAENLAASQFILSTSVAEGFGMAFLEPWLSHREVIARRLATVTTDFEDAGVQLPKLYDAIPIPGTAQWIEQCERERARMLSSTWQAIPEAFRPELDSIHGDQTDTIDFAKLTPARQIEVLDRIDSDSGFDSEVRQRSSSTIEWMHDAPSDELIQHNADTIEQQYSLARTGKQLHAIFDSLASVETERRCVGPAKAGTALQLIHQSRPFYPCRMEQPDG